MQEQDGPPTIGVVCDSGVPGQSRRTCHPARALLSPAPVLLLDEPTAHLDAELAGRLLDRVAALDRTVLLVTHRPEDLDGRWRRVELTARVPAVPG